MPSLLKLPPVKIFRSGSYGIFAVSSSRVYMIRFYMMLPLWIAMGCEQSRVVIPQVKEPAAAAITMSTIGRIPEPTGFSRVKALPGSFAAWLRTVPLKMDKRVYLYNGKLKPNQSAQFAVIDIPVGNKDLQQCADAVMRLRAEYLFSQEKYREIRFMAYSGTWSDW